MSIFPKKISNGENLIIHLRFSNKAQKIHNIKYVLSVLDPNKKEIFLKEDNIILGIGKEGFVKQLYYSLYINNNCKPGRYIVNFYIICNGQVIYSDTKNNDYFYVEKLKYYNSKNKTVIHNISNEKTLFILYKGKESKCFNINGKEKLNLEDKYDYIEYANNKFDIIENKEEQ